MKRCNTCKHYEADIAACKWAKTATIPYWLDGCYYGTAARAGEGCKTYERKDTEMTDSSMIERKYYEGMKCHADDLEAECERLHAEIAELKEQHAREIERIKKNHGCAREQGTTQFCHEALDAHKEADAMRADAALGAAVRRMPEGAMLWHSEDTWYLHPQDTPAAPMGQGDTPEAAMIAAGLMKGEGEC